MTYKIFLFFLKRYQKKIDPMSENQCLKDLPSHGEEKGIIGYQEKSLGISIRRFQVSSKQIHFTGGLKS